MYLYGHLVGHTYTRTEYIYITTFYSAAMPIVRFRKKQESENVCVRVYVKETESE